MTLKQAAARRKTANRQFEERVVLAVKEGNPVAKVAQDAGITRPTVYAILNRNKKES